MNTRIITVEDGIPIPKIRKPKGMWDKIIRKMKPGESFMLESERDKGTAYMSAQRNGLKITTRKIDGRGYRVWRVK